MNSISQYHPSAKLGYFLIGFSILLGSFAQLAMKWGMNHADFFLHHLLQNFLSVSLWWDARVALFLVGCGIFAYALSLAAWLFALTHLPLNKAYPLLSISYVVVYAASILLPWFHEAFSITQIVGVLFICGGVWLIVGSTQK